MIAERLTDVVTFHGEGAVWHEPWGGLRFVDMLAGDVLFRDDATGAISRKPTGSDVAAMVRPREGGGIVVATRSRFVFFDADGNEERMSREIVPTGYRFNEGAIDPQGRVLCGTVGDPPVDGGAELWRLEADGSATRVLDGLTTSNGLAFTPDGSRAYYVDSPTRRLDVFDVDAGGDLHDRRTLADLGDVEGFPDGLCLDTEGGVWVAFYDGSAVRRFDADGNVTAVVELLAVSRATSCTIGGPSATTLVITTSREHLPDGEQPAAGSLYAAEVGVRGVPVRDAAV